MKAVRQVLAVALGALALTALPRAAATPIAAVDPLLGAQLRTAPAHEPMQAFVHGESAPAAAAAADRAGLRVLARFDRIDAVLAAGTASAVRAVRSARGVSFVEGDRPIELHLDSSHLATNGEEARSGTSTIGGFDGSGVSVAVVDTGIDGTHPFFLDAEGESKVVRNVRTGCPLVGVFAYHSACWVDDSVRNDSDTLGTGGHGTHVAGIVAGYDVTTTGPRELDLHGAAPGARLVGISVSAGPNMGSGVMGLTWVLDNHAAPCGSRKCPPIKVVNNSWGPVGGASFCEECAATKTQRALVEAGVVVVWSAGNSGGDGSGKDELGQSQDTGGYGKDPTPGILMVASYDDRGTGDRDGQLSSFSSRGIRGVQSSYPDITAPGSSILSSCRPHLPLCEGSIGEDGPGPDDLLTFTTMSGTSMAAPHISGIVAQLFHANPAATPAQVEWAIAATAYKFGSDYESAPRWGVTTSFDKGHGLVDAAAAVRAIRSSALPSDASLQPAESPED